MVLKSMNFCSIVKLSVIILHYYCSFSLLFNCSWFSSSSGVFSKSESLDSSGIERLLKVLIYGIPFSFARSVSL